MNLRLDVPDEMDRLANKGPGPASEQQQTTNSQTVSAKAGKD